MVGRYVFVGPKTRMYVVTDVGRRKGFVTKNRREVEAWLGVSDATVRRRMESGNGFWSDGVVTVVMTYDVGTVERPWSKGGFKKRRDDK